MGFQGISEILSQLEEILKKLFKITNKSGKLVILSDLLTNPLLSDFEMFFQDFSELRQYFRNSLKSHVRITNPHMRFQGILKILSELREILKKLFKIT